MLFTARSHTFHTVYNNLVLPYDRIHIAFIIKCAHDLENSAILCVKALTPSIDGSTDRTIDRGHLVSLSVEAVRFYFYHI